MGADPIPLYRAEVPVYAAVPEVVRATTLSTLGTFHERQGAQFLLDDDGSFGAGWLRVIGESHEQHWKGDVSPGFDGDLRGLQLGVDLYTAQREGNGSNRFGVFLGTAQIDGDVDGFVIGQVQEAGRLELDSNSVGMYWTRTGTDGGYLDAVLAAASLDGTARSLRGLHADIDGRQYTASLEGGYPFALGKHLRLEPQAQIVWQHSSLDGTGDDVSRVVFDTADGINARIGARLHGMSDTARWQPYLKLNLWHAFGGSDKAWFDDDRIVTRQRGTSIEFGAGIVGRLTDSTSLFFVADYSRGVSGEKLRILQGNAGLRIDW